jgi:hypothetical protein
VDIDLADALTGYNEELTAIFLLRFAFFGESLVNVVG